MMLHRYDPFFDAGSRSRRLFLNADVYRLADSFYLDIDAPGVALDDIDIEIEKKSLTVKVERRELVDDARTDLVRGRPTGTFVRRFFLGEGLDGEAIEAKYDDGVLTLTIPVVETAKARKVSISAGSAGEIEG